MTVIDGATDQTHSVNVGFYPLGVDINTATNKIYVVNQCGNDPNCASDSTMTVIDGGTLGTTNVAVGGSFAISLAVNAVTNKIYLAASCAGAPSCQGEPNGTVSVIDGVTHAYTSVPAGIHPYFVAINSGNQQNLHLKFLRRRSYLHRQARDSDRYGDGDRRCDAVLREPFRRVSPLRPGAQSQPPTESMFPTFAATISPAPLTVARFR